MIAASWHGTGLVLQCGVITSLQQSVMPANILHRDLWLARGCHWRELPQVSFLSQQTCACRDNTRLLSRQTYACRDKSFVATNVCVSRQSFCQTRVCRDKYLSRQKLCRGKHNFVAASILLSRQKTCFFCDKRRALSGQTHVCRDKLLSLQK